MNRLERFILDIFNNGDSVAIVILGRRGTGKTDNSLLISEIVEKYRRVSLFASNIKIYTGPFPIDHITNLQDLDLWATTGQGKKLFILDEAGKSFRRRTPMSKLNIELMDKLQTLRKYKLSLIIIAPDEKYIDSAGLGSDVLDGIIFKTEFKNPKIGLYTNAQTGEREKFGDIPGTSIKYDTWDIAPFKLKPEITRASFTDKDLLILYDWVNGKTTKDLGLNPNEINRIVRRFIKRRLDDELRNNKLSVRGISTPEPVTVSS